MGWEWRLIVENCPGCGICVDVCEKKALVMTRDMPYPVAKPGKCEGCLTCLKECPFGAIEVKEIKEEEKVEKA